MPDTGDQRDEPVNGRAESANAERPSLGRSLGALVGFASLMAFLLPVLSALSNIAGVLILLVAAIPAMVPALVAYGVCYALGFRETGSVLAYVVGFVAWMFFFAVILRYLRKHDCDPL